MRNPKWIVVLLAATWLTFLGHPTRLPATERLNVLLILADDHCYRDFGFMGNATVHTPNLDQLASQSAVYPNGYVSMSVCRPSLATLLTGLYPHQHGIHFNHPPPGLGAMRAMTAEAYHRTRASADYLIERVPTLPRILATHGYACLQTGKHWEGSYTTAGFTHGMTLGIPSDTESQITGTRRQNNGELVAHGNGDAGLVIGRQTLQPIFTFIDEQAGEKPFFVWYAPFMPHTPFDAPQNFRELYRDSSLPEYLLPYYAEIARFDASVGKLVEFLELRQLRKNTLIVFLSDNGFRPDRLNHQRQDQHSKLTHFEDGLRTPILLSLPGEISFTRHIELVQAIDIVPTVLSALGMEDLVTTRMPGLDLMPSARGQEDLQERAAFGAIYPNDARTLGTPSKHVRGRWIRDGDFKLILPGTNERPIGPELYNVISDPDERHNLVNDPAMSKRTADLHRKLDAWWTAARDQGVTRLP